MDSRSDLSLQEWADSSSDWTHNARLHALGNAVVPQCAYEVGLYVRHLLDTWQDAPSDAHGDTP